MPPPGNRAAGITRRSDDMVERYQRRKGKPTLLGNHQKCWLWGRHVVIETLRAARWPVLELRLSDRLSEEDLAFASEWSETREVVLKIEPFDRLTELCHSREHQGFLAKMAAFPYDRVEDMLSAAKPRPLFGLLDGLQDPHNFGAIIRSAHVLGVNALFVPTHGQVEVTAQVARSSAGAVNHIPIAQADDIVALAEQLRSRGIRVIGTSQRASQSIGDCDLARSAAIVIGNEGTGIRNELLAVCDELVTIPQFGALESLNAAVSAGILFYEAQRQRAATTVIRSL
jgi:23S rRNA (guanosine2251-2'-O)-methyltransferase